MISSVQAFVQCDNSIVANLMASLAVQSQPTWHPDFQVCRLLPSHLKDIILAVDSSS